MKKSFTILFALAALVLAVSCEKSGQLTGHPDIITVYGNGYIDDPTTIFDTLAVVIPDTTVLRGPIHPYFKGFRMLTSPAMSQNGGTIVTDVDCPVYIIAPTIPVPTGWLKVLNSKANGLSMYTIINDERIDLSIFEARAYAGEPITIPVTNTAFCPTPIAKEIKYVKNN